MRLVGATAPVSLFTPTVREGMAGRERVQRYLRGRLERLPFALPMADALRRLAAREAWLSGEVIESTRDEPTTAKRRLTLT